MEFSTSRGTKLNSFSPQRGVPQAPRSTSSGLVGHVRFTTVGSQQIIACDPGRSACSIQNEVPYRLEQLENCELWLISKSVWESAVANSGEQSAPSF